MVKQRTKAEIEAENRWWLSLSPQQRIEYLDKWHEQEQYKTKIKMIFLCIVLTLYVILAFVPVAVMVYKWM